MIVWGGWVGSGDTPTGNRYNPQTNTWTHTTTSGAPPGVSGHAAVWTGTEMIVWGGHDGYNDRNTGGRYDPVSDSWRLTSTGTNVPAVREIHCSVWTGSRMIVWGGKKQTTNPQTYYNSGGLYDPVSDTWAPTSTGTNVPGPRDWFTAVWTGTEMIVWGGYNGTADINTGGRYNPATDTWMPTSMGANVPSTRDSHTAVWTGAQMIVWASGDAVLTNDGARYTPSTDSWTPISTVGAPPPRYSHTAVWTGTEMIGWGGNVDPSTYLGDGGRYCVQSCAATAPTESAWVTLSASGGSATIAWTSIATASAYDAVRGGLGQLLGSGGDFSLATGACLANDSSQTSVMDGTAPPAADGLWYLVRGLNCGGNGTYDDGTQQSSRDAGIAASVHACP